MKANEKKLTFVAILIAMMVGLFVNVPVGAFGGCVADIDADGDVDATDFVLLLCAFGDCPGCPEDLNGDGVVDVLDLLILLQDFFCGNLVEPTGLNAGLEVQGFVPNSVLDLYVFRIYIRLPEATDRLVYVYRADVTPSTGSFYQHSEGGDTAPDSDDVDMFPDLEWDSFVTIELAQVPPGEEDETFEGPGFHSSHFNTDSGAHLDGSWLSLCTGNQGVPDKEGRVLAAQLTLEDASADPADLIEGELIIGWMDESDTLHHWSTLLRAKVEPSPSQCPADLDGNGDVGASDLLFLLANWGACP